MKDWTNHAENSSIIKIKTKPRNETERTIEIRASHFEVWLSSCLVGETRRLGLEAGCHRPVISKTSIMLCMCVSRQYHDTHNIIGIRIEAQLVFQFPLLGNYCTTEPHKPLRGHILSVVPSYIQTLHMSNYK